MKTSSYLFIAAGLFNLIAIVVAQKESNPQ